MSQQQTTAVAERPNGSTPPNNTSEPGKLTLGEAVAVFKGQLAERKDDFAVQLPSHITPDRFQRVIVTAVNLNPDLLRADRRSLFNSCSKAASDGLLPDGRDGALVIFGKEVTWMPMVSGIIKKARQSGEIAALGARIVYAKEIEQARFTHKVVDGVPKVDHDPILWGERGAAVLVYSFVRFKDGTVDFEFLHADDVAKIRGVSRSKDKGPWVQWPDEMWKKSAIRRHAKRLPISSELFDTIARDDEMTEFDRQRREAQDAILVRAGTQLGAPRTEDVIDAETGEVTTRQTEEVGEGVLADDAARAAEDEDQTFKTAETTVAKMIEVLADPEMKLEKDFVEFKERAHTAINEMDLVEDQKSVLIGRFNAAYLERTRGLAKTGKAAAR